MHKPEDEHTPLGAEAMPGGFGEIDQVMRHRPSPSDRAPARPAKAPLLGLIALAEHWMRKDGERRR
jgi:hypothetical protein